MHFGGYLTIQILMISLLIHEEGKQCEPDLKYDLDGSLPNLKKTELLFCWLEVAIS